MKLKSIFIKNFKRIREAMIDLDDHLIVIGGRNDQGKTTALDAIRTALGSKKDAPDVPIRRGAKKSEILLKGDELTVEWSQSRKGSANLRVRNAEGVVQPSPHTLLSKFLSTLTFRPLDYAKMNPEKQGEIARRLAGLDFAEQDKERDTLYRERTDIGRDMKRERAVFESLPRVKDAPEAEISVADSVRELDRRRRVNQENEQHREALQNRRARVELTKTTIVDKLQEGKDRMAEHEAKIKEMSAELDELCRTSDAEIVTLETDRNTAAGEAEELAGKVAKLVDEDVDEVRAVIDSADDVNKRFRQAADRDAAKAKVHEFDASYRKISRAIENIDEAKTAAIQGAKYPVEGLTVDENGAALLDGLPFDQAGDAKKLRCSTAIGFAINPDFKMLLIDQGEMLDDENLALLGEIVKEAGGQAIIARVSTGDECSVIIENGEIVASDDA